MEYYSAIKRNKLMIHITNETCNTLDESLENSVIWEKTMSEGDILWDYIYITFLK